MPLGNLKHFNIFVVYMVHINDRYEMICNGCIYGDWEYLIIIGELFLGTTSSTLHNGITIAIDGWFLNGSTEGRTGTCWGIHKHRWWQTLEISLQSLQLRYGTSQVGVYVDYSTATTGFAGFSTIIEVVLVSKKDSFSVMNFSKKCKTSSLETCCGAPVVCITTGVFNVVAKLPPALLVPFIIMTIFFSMGPLIERGNTPSTKTSPS